MKKIAIIGAGSWGSALAIYLAKQGHEVKLWSYNDDERDLINNKRECVFLPGVEIPEGVWASENFEKVLDGAEIILHVTPSKFVRSTIKNYRNLFIFLLIYL